MHARLVVCNGCFLLQILDQPDPDLGGLVSSQNVGDELSLNLHLYLHIEVCEHRAQCESCP
jgi:hypothetical protein